MNPTRLFILSALAKHGPMHGHQLRRDTRIDRTQLWSHVKPGSLYGALHRLQDEGLIETVRTEQSGGLPERTVFAITAAGSQELCALRDEAYQEVGLRPDPVDLALVAGSDLEPELVREHVNRRIATLRAEASRIEQLTQGREPDHSIADDLVVEHARLRIRAEIEWHQLVLDKVAILNSAPSFTDLCTAPSTAQPDVHAPSRIKLIPLWNGLRCTVTRSRILESDNHAEPNGGRAPGRQFGTARTNFGRV